MADLISVGDRAWVVIWTIKKNGKFKEYYLSEYLDGTRDMYYALKATTLALACAWVQEHQQMEVDNQRGSTHPVVSSLYIKEVDLQLAGRNCLKHPE